MPPPARRSTHSWHASSASPGAWSMPTRRLRRGIVLAVHPDADLRDRALELASQIAAVPSFATLETKRRILIERERIFGPLFEEEERVFSEALLR